MAEIRSEHWETMVNILDGQFPKGKSKERGNALVMLAYIEMMLNGHEFDENGKPIPRDPMKILMEITKDIDCTI